MKLCNGFADDPDVLGMFNIIMYIYYIFVQQIIVNLLNANG